MHYQILQEQGNRPNLRTLALNQAAPKYPTGQLPQAMYASNAFTLDDLRVPPANRLEKLSGYRAGQYNIRINDQWRIGFEWIDGDAYNVEIVDYH